MKKFIYLILGLLLISLGTYAQNAPVFTSIPITDAVEDALYTYTAEASDIDVGDVLTYSAPELPGWMFFSIATHILSGTPDNDDVGDHNVTLRVNDGTVDVDQVFVITVENVNDAPTFTSTPVTTVQQGTEYSYTATAEDIDGDDLTYSAPLLPGWLLFDVDSQLLSGTPGNDDVGDHPVTLAVFDGTVTVDQDFIITVEDVNDAPTFTSIPVTTAQEEIEYTYTATAEDLDEDDLTYSAPVLPGWLLFDVDTQILSGTPGNEDVGDHPVTLTVFDGTVSVDQVFIIAVGNVNDAPTFTSTPLTSALQGSLYSYTAAAEDIDGDDLTYSAPELPNWLSFNINTQILRGTPDNDDVGNHDVTLSVFDGTVTVDQEFVIAVGNVNDPPIVTSEPDTSASPGSAYEYTITAVDLDGDNLTYSAPVLPGWLTFNSSSHLLSATPGDDDVGLHDVTLRVTDGNISVNQSFTINVGYGNRAPTFTSDPETSAVVGTAYIYSIKGADIDGDDLTYSAPQLPEWLTFYPATNVISGIPGSNDLGIHHVIVRISDGTVSADQSYPISVYNRNDAPTFTSSPVTTGQEGVYYQYTSTAEDLDDDELTFSAPLLPDWLSFNTGTHLLSGTPDNHDEGLHNVTLRVTDGIAAVDQEFIITVEHSAGVGIDEVSSPNQLIIYPNPTSGRFMVELPKEFTDDVTLEIVDVLGKTLQQQVIPSHQTVQEEFDLSDQPAGIYFIRITHSSGTSLGRLIIQ